MVWTREDASRESIRAGELHGAAMAKAHALRALGIQPDDLVLLALPYAPELLEVLLGALYGAAIPAILPYATAQPDLAPQVERVRRLAATAQARAVVCPPFLAESLAAALGNGCEVIDAGALGGFAERWHPPVSVRPGSTALIQFTSGTTGGQKGVRLSHAAVLHFLTTCSDTLGVTRDDVVVSWLPLYHDLGVITGLLLPLSQGITTAMISPSHWVRSPIVMLRALHDFRGSLTWMPNFAFSHIARTVRDADLEALDLSAWRFSANGAEPVREDSIAALCARLARCGLRPESIRAGYGMAENTLTATITSEPPRVDRISAADFQSRRIARPVPGSTPGALAFVSNGHPLPGVEVAIADEQGRHLAERELGEILLRSANLFDGYHLRPDLTAAALRDGWFRSGDLGYLAEGELYVCAAEGHHDRRGCERRSRGRRGDRRPLPRDPGRQGRGLRSARRRPRHGAHRGGGRAARAGPRAGRRPRGGSRPAQGGPRWARGRRRDGPLRRARLDQQDQQRQATARRQPRAVPEPARPDDRKLS